MSICQSICSNTSIDVKTGSLDPADFAMSRLLICQLWPFAQWLGQLLAYRSRHRAICQGALPDMPCTVKKMHPI
jgi:hypothetical protein